MLLCVEDKVVQMTVVASLGGEHPSKVRLNFNVGKNYAVSEAYVAYGLFAYIRHS